MLRIAVADFPLSRYEDPNLIRGFEWFMSFLSAEDWATRKTEIEDTISIRFVNADPFSVPLNEGTLLLEKKDVIGWYLFLVNAVLNEPHKYEYFQGARVLPIFQRLGQELELLKKIGGIDRRVRDLLKRRRSEADALLFEILVALSWARNGFEVSFIEEAEKGKTPDLIARKGAEVWHVECKRQTKTADYTYRETLKRQKMVWHVAPALMMANAVLDVVFHVELESLPDTYLKDLLEHILPNAMTGRIVSNAQVDIDLSFVDLRTIQNYLRHYPLKNPSPTLNTFIDERTVNNKAFTGGVVGDFFRVGEGNANNLFLREISNAYGFFWRCDAPEALWAKARDIKNQLSKAIAQFVPGMRATVHIGMETFEGPEVEAARMMKILETIQSTDPGSTSVEWIYLHFFQSYSPPDQNWLFDETISVVGLPDRHSPLSYPLLIIPEDVELLEGIAHWQRPVPK